MKKENNPAWCFGDVKHSDISLSRFVLVQGLSELITKYRGKVQSGDIWDATNETRVWTHGDKPLKFIASRFERGLERSTVDEKGKKKDFIDYVAYPDTPFERLEEMKIDGKMETVLNNQFLLFYVHLINDLEEKNPFPTKIKFIGFSLEAGKNVISNCVKATSKGLTPASVMFELSTKDIHYTTKDGINTNFFVYNVKALKTPVKLGYIDYAFKTSQQKLLE